MFSALILYAYYIFFFTTDLKAGSIVVDYRQILSTLFLDYKYVVAIFAIVSFELIV